MLYPERNSDHRGHSHSRDLNKCWLTSSHEKTVVTIAEELVLVAASDYN